MKLLHFSDLHIGMENYSKLDPKSGLSTRLLDFFETFDFIVDKAFAEEVDAVIFAGDAYKTRDPNPTQQRGFGERIRKIAKKIPVVLVVGNHDTPNAEGKANTLDIYSALEIDNVWVSRSPELLEIPTKSGTLQVVTLPWLHKNDYKQVAEKLQLLYEKIKDPQVSGPAIFLSHCEVVGSQYGSEKGMAIANDVTIPLSLIQDRRISYCALGHIHKHQVLSKPGDTPLIVYSGSPQRIDFGEEKEEKGICLVEINGKTTGFQFIPTNARKFLTITVNLKGSDSSPTKTVLDEIAKHDVKDKIIRVIINIPADLEQALEMDKIKKPLSDAHVIAGISRNVERRERLRLEGAQEVERLTPIDALRKYFEAKKYSKEKQKQLEEYATKLLES
ncbi:exonuclease SbcCD subunit D [Candidatus Daviesbacteria bacterium]|nr:exonuclease SbcCD subunit D [Candidatus Daviesbacteria bacterium]